MRRDFPVGRIQQDQLKANVVSKVDEDMRDPHVLKLGGVVSFKHRSL
jgi:hypothetical protein